MIDPQVGHCQHCQLSTVKPQSNDEIAGSVCIVTFHNGPSLDARQCVTENRSVTRGDTLVVQSGPERSGGTGGGNVRPLPGPLVWCWCG